MFANIDDFHLFSGCSLAHALSFRRARAEIFYLLFLLTPYGCLRLVTLKLKNTEKPITWDLGLITVYCSVITWWSQRAYVFDSNAYLIKNKQKYSKTHAIL